jgi:polyisoprenyl-teichoic acid--peptidoglycan teichoic acid transferase
MSAAPTAGPGAQPTRRRAAHARRRRPHRRRWLAILAVATVAVVVVVAVTVAGGYGYARLRVGQVPSVHVPSLTPAPPPGRPMTLLVVGSDTRQGLRRQDRGRFGAVGGQRGDVILLVHLVPASHRAWVLSIPRDLYVPVAGTGGRAKINAALARGPEQLVQTIKANFGIPLSHYLLVDFDGFRAVVDAVGGIRLDFPSPARDDDNGHNNSGLLVTTPGCRHLDGDQALALARSRYYQYQDRSGRWHPDPGYDLGRIRRQQILLRALAAKALRRGLTNPLRANAVLAAVARHLTRDDTLTLGQAVRLAGQFRAFRPGALVGLTIPTVPALRRGQVVLRPGQPGFEQAWARGGWEQILLPVQPATRQTVARFLGHPIPAQPAHPAPPPPAHPATPRPWDPRPC